MTIMSMIIMNKIKTLENASCHVIMIEDNLNYYIIIIKA